MSARQLLGIVGSRANSNSASCQVMFIKREWVKFCVASGEKKSQNKCIKIFCSSIQIFKVDLSFLEG